MRSVRRLSQPEKAFLAHPGTKRHRENQRRSHGFSAAILTALAFVSGTVSEAQAQPAAPDAVCQVTGRVTAGGLPLSGVAVVLTRVNPAATVATSSGVDGSFQVSVAGPGVYVLRATLTGFAEHMEDVTLAADPCRATTDLQMVLRSRASRGTPGSASSAESQVQDPGVTRPAGTAQRPRRQGAGGAGAPGGTASGGQRGAGRFQDLEVVSDSSAQAFGEQTDTAAQALLPPGFSADAPTESVATAGSGGQVQTADALLFGDRIGWLAEAGGDLDALARRVAQAGLEGPGGRPFPGGEPGGFGPAGGGLGPGGGGPPGLGPGGGPVMMAREGFGGFNQRNRVQGSVNYQASGSPFDAKPFSLNGQPTEKAAYFQNRFGATLGGPVKLPGLYDGSSRTSFSVSYSGARTRRPYDAYSTVPTAAEREGDFSALGNILFDPLTGEPFADSSIPANRIDPAARALLAYIPLPNQPGLAQNYHYVTATTSSSDQVSLRLTHLLRSSGQAASSARPGRGGGRGGGGRRPSLSVGLTYRRSSAEETASFPTLGGANRGSAWDLPVTLSLPTGPFFHQLRFDYNRNETRGENLFADVHDVAGDAGIAGVSSDPFDWGVPSLSFTTISPLRDRNASFRRDQRLGVSDVVTISRGAHNVRFGGGFRTQRFDSHTNENARGSFVFTGLYTSGPLASSGAKVGSDVADFLLGLAQQASVQYGPGRISLRGDSWNLFVQDDWRVRGNLTLNLGIRYEYVSPFEETNGRLVNLDVTPGFTAAVPVLAGQVGPFSGAFPGGLVSGDHDNVAPRLAVAWRPRQRLTVRAGFGLNYTLGAYAGIAQRLAAQPPVAVNSTLLGTAQSPLLLEDALAQPGPPTANSFGIDRGYELPAVAIWNLNTQWQLGSAVVDVGYAGTRGYDLELQRAPNRGPNGLRILGVAPFIWQSSGATSIMHAGTLRVRKRMTHGFGGGLSYTYGKSIDDASSIGGGATVVAQNDQDLEAERGLSSFDRRHALSVNWTVELPIGPGRKWLREGALASIVGGWVWTGTVSIQSGTPFTARVVGAFRDVAQGVNGTLRAKVSGQSVSLSHPTIARWFDTDAFVVPPDGSFGDAGRNTVMGPGTCLVNASVTKNVALGQTRALSIRVQATNLLNTPPLVGIDTVVNSPTYGQVIQAGPMRSVQIQTRFRF